MFAGLVEIHGNISYASQDAWLFPSTVRQNIIFGEEYNKKRYLEVVRACALEYDFSLLDDGDLTIVADKGMNLSKGQQARINLARAVYRNTNIYLLDDSLTALDSHVQDFIFHECILKFLKDKICILVSQNTLHLEKASSVVILNEGEMLFSGDSTNMDKEAINELTATIIKADETKNKEVGVISEKTAALLETEQQQSRRNIYREDKKSGKVSMNVYKKYFQYGGGLIVFSFIMLLYVISQFCDSSADKLLSKW